MIELIIVRHGQSVADIEGRMEGRADFPLTELGHTQAVKLTKWLKGNFCTSRIISSPLKRASQTAKYIADEYDIDIQYCDDLMEIDIGMVSGLLRKEADENYPVAKDGFKPHDARGVNGESEIDVRARAEDFLNRLITEMESSISKKQICIVSHGFFIDMLFRSFLNMPINANICLYTHDTGVHFWRINGSKKEIVFTNYQEHLKL